MTNLTHFQQRENTSIFKSFHGWEGKTTLKVNNQDWVITTMKRYNGLIISYAQAVKGNSNGNFLYSPFEDKQIKLLSIEKVATESAIKAAHFEALSKFDSLNEANELPVNQEYEIKRGQLLRFDGYGHFMAIKYVVYEVVNSEYGKIYKCVDLLEKNFVTKELPRPVNEKFGIGTYFNEGETMDEDELNNLLIEVNQLTKDREAERIKQAEESAILKAEALSKGAQIIPSIPIGVKAVIIGELMEDDSDPMTDYFASHCTKIIFLAFSNHSRDLFDEMRKAAVNSSFTEHLVNGEEHREKYAGGQGYYIGGYRSGWRISKTNISSNGSYGVTLEEMQIAAGEDRYFIPTDKTPEKPTQVIPAAVQIIDYSEKAIAVIGDTKPIKDQLKALGGKFNFRLSCGVGWIFSKTKTEIVKSALGL